MTNSADKVVVIRLAKADWELLWELADRQNRDFFTHNVRTPATTKVKRVVLITAHGALVALGLARTHMRSGDIDTQVKFSLVRELNTPLSLDELENETPVKSRRHVSDALHLGGVLPSASGNDLLATLKRLRPETATILVTLMRAQSEDELGTPGRRQLLAEQRDALALGLEAAGLDSRAALKMWHAPAGDAPFLAGLDTTTSEAALIRHDASYLDDWVRINGTIHDVLEFVDPTDEHRRVTVVYADKEPLENIIGTDLVYYRHQNPGYVLVQYKRLKKEPTKADPDKAVFRPDQQLEDEIGRMRKVQSQSNASDLPNWRLSSEPFYMKLCDGMMSRPEGNRLVTGMYFPLGLFETLLESPNILGPSAGKAIGWHNAERYLSNGEFIELLKHGWIGSAGDVTKEITALISYALDRKRSVTLVIDKTDPKKSKRQKRR